MESEEHFQFLFRVWFDIKDQKHAQCLRKVKVLSNMALFGVAGDFQYIRNQY